MDGDAALGQVPLSEIKDAQKSTPEPAAPEPEVPEGTEMVTMTMREALRDAMAEEMRRDPDVFVMGQGVDDPRGMFGTTLGLHKEFGAERNFDVPLSEDVDSYFKREVLPHAPDAWIDHEKTKVGFEIPFNRHFYVFEAPRELAEIDAELKECTKRIAGMIAGLTA